MKKITYLLSMLVIGTALLTTSCVKNDEPAGIEEMRKGKAELLSAQATVQLAEAEIKKATALCWAADARAKNAVAEAQEITNKLNSETNALKIEELKAKQAEILETAKKDLLDAQTLTAVSNEAYLKALANLNVTMVSGITGIYQTELEKIVNSGTPSLKSVIGDMATEQAKIAKSQADILVYTTKNIPAIERKLNNEIPVKELALESAKDILSYLESMPKADLGTLRADLAAVKAEINAALAKVESLKVEKGVLVAKNAPLEKAAVVIGEKISGIASTSPTTGVVVPTQTLTLTIAPAIEDVFEAIAAVPSNNQGGNAVEVVGGKYVYSVKGLQPMFDDTEDLVAALNEMVLASNDTEALNVEIANATAEATKAASDLTAANTKLTDTRAAYKTAAETYFGATNFNWNKAIPTTILGASKTVRAALTTYNAINVPTSADMTTLAAALKTYAVALKSLTGESINPNDGTASVLAAGVTASTTNDLATALTTGDQGQFNAAAAVIAALNGGSSVFEVANEPATVAKIAAGGAGKAFKDAVVDLYGSFGVQFNNKMIYVLAEMTATDAAYVSDDANVQTIKEINIHDGSTLVLVASGVVVTGKYAASLTAPVALAEFQSLKDNKTVWAALAADAKTKVDANTTALKAAQAEKLVADAAYNKAKEGEDLIDAKISEYGAVSTGGTILYDLTKVATLYQANIDAITDGSTGINDQIQNAIDTQLALVETAQANLETAQANLAAWKEHGMEIGQNGALVANFIKAEEAKIATAKAILAERQTQFDTLTAQKDAIIALIKNQK